MTPLLDPRRHAARPPPVATPAPVPISLEGGRIQADGGGAVCILPGATRTHLLELRRWIEEASPEERPR